MHLTVIILLALAGLGFCAAGIMRWRSLSRPNTGRTEQHSSHGLHWPLWSAFLLLTVATVLAIVKDDEHRDVGYGALAVWAGIASLLFLSRWLAMPSRSLLVLPLGAVALMVATVGAAGPGRTATDASQTPWIIYLHATFMTLHLASLLIAGTAGGLYLIVAWLLKHPSPRVLRLPNLHLLERLTERSILAATALLVGGLATGGVAMRSHPIDLVQPTALLGIATMILLMSFLSLRTTNRLNHHTMAIAAVIVAGIAMLSVLSQIILAHSPVVSPVIHAMIHSSINAVVLPHG